MFKKTPAFCSFSTDDMEAAKKFYGGILGLEVNLDKEGLDVKLAGGAKLFIYQSRSKEFKPPEFTVLYFVVDDIEKAVDDLNNKGVEMEHYKGEFGTNEKGILYNNGKFPGPKAAAWFKDPAGHILAVIKEK